jgi:signal peptidase I
MVLGKLLDSFVKELVIFCKRNGLVIIIPVVFFFYIFYLCRVISPSMAPFAPSPSAMFGCRLSYVFNEPQRGDVIVFDEGTPAFMKPRLVKRIIGLPGDIVEVRDGRVYVNGLLLDEPYLMPPGFTQPGILDIYEVPPDTYFVLGDSRSDSNDSRFWEEPYVSKASIRAKIWFSLVPWPPGLNIAK